MFAHRILLILALAIWLMVAAHGNEDAPINSKSGSQKKSKRRSSRRGNKKDRLKKVVGLVESQESSIKLNLKTWSKPHNFTGNAVLTVAMGDTLMRRDAYNFAGTLRKTGYTGDIVVAIVAMADEHPFVAALRKLDVITYEAPSNCGHGAKTKMETGCTFEGSDISGSINMIRYALYQMWALKYSSSSLLLTSDFNDVFFQSDPFAYKFDEWRAPYSTYQLVVYQEAHPNAVIRRCSHNAGWIKGCYGQEMLNKIGSNTVSCSGNTLGTRDAIVAYTHFLLMQLNPAARYGKGTNMTNSGCITIGMDQGFHNFLIYNNILSSYMDVKIYQQGEGAVNVLGGFYGASKLLKFTLEEFNILKGTSPNKYVYNWDGEKSPIVHQMDRFLQNKQLEGGYTAHLGQFQDLIP